MEDIKEKPNQRFLMIKSVYFQQEDMVLPFALYEKIKDGTNQNFEIFVPANRPLTSDLIRNMRGMDLYIPYQQKQTFYQLFSIRPAAPQSNSSEILKQKLGTTDIPRSPIEQHPLRKALLKDTLSSCLDKQKFLPLINLVREEISFFELTLSPTCSLAKKLTEKTLNNESDINLITALSFTFAVLAGIEDKERLSELLIASCLHHIGFSQLPLELMKKSILLYNKKELKEYKNHPFLSKHLIFKSGLEINESTLDIILDHHERYDGSGFPKEKKADHIDELSCFLGFTSHCVEFSYGYIDGQKHSLKSTFYKIMSKNVTTGLEFHFGPIIEESLKFLFSTQGANNVP
jgi:hypothetical protein